MKKIHKNSTIFDNLLIILGIITLLFVGYLLFRKQSSLNITVKLNEENIRISPWSNGKNRQWIAGYFYPGMTERDGFNRIVAKVNSVHAYDTAPDSKDIYLNLTIKSTYTKSTNQHSFRGTPVLIGSPIKLQLDSILVEGLVTNIEGLKDPRSKVTLEMEARLGRVENPIFNDSQAVYTSIANSINQNSVITDNAGEEIIKIIEKKIHPSKRVVVNNLGNSIEYIESDRVVVYLKLRVSAIKIDGKYFIFDDSPLQIGGAIPIIMDKVSIWPEIISFNEIQ